MSTLTHRAVELQLGGSAVEATVADAIVRVVVAQRLSAPAVCEVTLSFSEHAARTEGGWDGAEPGDAMGLRVAGLPPSGGALFEGEVTAVTRRHLADGTTEVRIRGYDALHRLRRSQPLRVHTNVTVAQLARTLAADAGLSVEASEEGPTWPRLFQHVGARHTDLHLLTGVADVSGLWLTVRDGALHLLSAAGIGDPVELVLGDGLIEVSLEANIDAACGRVEAVACDLLTQQTRRGSADSARGPSPQPPAGRDSEVTLAGMWGGAAASDDLVQAFAQGELDLRASHAANCAGVALGRPDLRPGCRVSVKGIGSASEGKYVIASATHRITPDEGYLTEFSTVLPRSPGRPGAETAAVVAQGRVTSVDDPDGLGRVRVALTGRGDLESEWMQVLTPGAGGGKGLIALPDAGDDVLVLLAGDLTGQGVVLGGLFGTRTLPDGKPRDGGIDRFVFLTPKGQKVALDDKQGSVRIGNKDGSYVEMKPDRVTLHAAADLVVEAPGKSVVIRADRVDFKRG